MNYQPNWNRKNIRKQVFKIRNSLWSPQDAEY